MPRYIVKYTKPGQVEGARLFDIARDASEEIVRVAAEKTAGPGATIVSVTLNDNSPIGDWQEGSQA